MIRRILRYGKLFKKYAKEAKNRGYKNYSANGIFEIIRWDTGISGTGKFKINDHFRPDYARKMMEEYPEFKDFFRIKGLKAPRS
jgi:hypothetical protein